MIAEYNGRMSAKVIKAKTTNELLLETARWPKVQKRLAEKVWQRERISLRLELEPLDLLMMDALQEKKTSCWIKDLDFGSVLEPKQGSKMALADEEFQYLLRRMMPGQDPHGTGLHKLTWHWCHEEFEPRMTHAETCCAHVRGASRHNAFQEALMDIVHELGGAAKASGLSMPVPPACCTKVPMCQGCNECEKPKKVRVDVEFGGLAPGGHFAVDVGNVEIRTKNARYPRVENADRFLVARPVVEAESDKTGTYADLCQKARNRDFIPAIMSSFAAPGKGMTRLVAILADRLQAILGATSARSKRRILRRFQTTNMREIARNGLCELYEQRAAIRRAAEIEEYHRQQRAEREAQLGGGVSPGAAATAFLNNLSL